MPPLPGAGVTVWVCAAPPALLLGLRILSASFGTKINASATQIAMTTRSVTTLAPVGPINDFAVSEPSTCLGAPLVRAVTEYACRMLRRNSLGRLTVSRPGTRTMPCGGTTTGCRVTSTAVLYGARASRCTVSGCNPVFCSTTKNLRL